MASSSSSSSTKRQRLNESGNSFEEVVPPSVSASSASTRNKLSYDVFINYRGCDAKETLAKDIYDALTRRRAKVFLDKPELEAGDSLPFEIQKAMESALLQIAILSPRYAESAWCLAGLSFMLKSGKRIIPIFYGVDPADFRYDAKGKGIYASALCKQEEKKRYSPGKLQEWISALQKISLVSGPIVNINNDDDSKGVLEKLEKELAEVMKRRLLVSKDPLFGLEETVVLEAETQECVLVEADKEKEKETLGTSETESSKHQVNE